MTGAAGQEAYHALCAYTLTLHDPAFIHQHVVDAHAAQAADAGTKPIALSFALAGLYLHVEHGLSGREVQRAHMRMARARHAWPAFALPAHRGSMTAADVMARPEGPGRDAAIDAWCASVWEAFGASRPAVIALLERHAIR